MELENKGTYSIIYVQKYQKYCITYNINNAELVLPNEKYHFDFYTAAQEYIDRHQDELDDYTVALKRKQEEERRKKESAEGEEEVGLVPVEPVVPTEVVVPEEAEQVEENKDEDNSKKKKSNFMNGFIKFVAGFLAAVITLVGGHYAAKGISKIKNTNNTPGTSQTQTNPTNPTTENETQPTLNEELTDELFEDLTLNFAKIIKNAGITLETDDIVEFASLINIDQLCETNPDLIKEVAGEQTKEEYLTETFKVLNQIAQYNSDLYFTSDTRGTTQGFIKVSDIIADADAKMKIEYYESLLEEMAIASNNKDKEEVNRIATTFCNSINNPTSQYSALPDGVGIGLYSTINAMINIVSRDVNGVCYLNDVNLKKLVILSSCEKYISNVFDKYTGCMLSPTYELKLQAMTSKAKVRTRKM